MMLLVVLASSRLPQQMKVQEIVPSYFLHGVVRVGTCRRLCNRMPGSSNERLFSQRRLVPCKGAKKENLSMASIATRSIHGNLKMNIFETTKKFTAFLMTILRL